MDHSYSDAIIAAFTKKVFPSAMICKDDDLLKVRKRMIAAAEFLLQKFCFAVEAERVAVALAQSEIPEPLGFSWKLVYTVP